jgi:hypothetical protein
MTSQSPRIYTYKITFEEVPYYYYGSKKEKYYNQKYFGSPKANKWCWELYTPKKQILEFFDYNDKGYEECRKVEDRLIKPVLNDPWCLNERYGGTYSIKILRKSGAKGGKIGGKKGYANGLAKLTFEQRSQNSKISGKIGGKVQGDRNRELKIGVCGRSKEQRRIDAKKGGLVTNKQKWICLETGYICTPGPLTLYQRARGIDTSKRQRYNV